MPTLDPFGLTTAQETTLADALNASFDTDYTASDVNSFGTSCQGLETEPALMSGPLFTFLSLMAKQIAQHAG